MAAQVRMSNNRRLLLTGPPGIGKTTAIKKTYELLQQMGISPTGFYTEELRENNKRIGFDIVTLDGKRAPLARLCMENDNSRFKVGKYSVFVNDFESVAIPVLQQSVETKRVIIVDEIGKMELFSKKFIKQIERIFEHVGEMVLLATILISQGKPIPLLQTIRSKESTAIFDVSYSNRNELPNMLKNEIARLLQ